MLISLGQAPKENSVYNCQTKKKKKHGIVIKTKTKQNSFNPNKGNKKYIKHKKVGQIRSKI